MNYSNLSLRENPYFEVEELLENYQQITEYTLTRFSDRMVEHPWTFLLEKQGVYRNLPIYKLIHYEGEVVEEGTDLSEKNLGNVDVGVAILFEWIKFLKEELLTLSLKTGGLELTTLNGMIANAYAVTFFDLGNEIEIIRGYYDPQKGEVWS